MNSFVISCMASFVFSCEKGSARNPRTRHQRIKRRRAATRTPPPPPPPSERPRLRGNFEMAASAAQAPPPLQQRHHHPTCCPQAPARAGLLGALFQACSCCLSTSKYSGNVCTRMMGYNDSSLTRLGFLKVGTLVRNDTP